METKRWTEERAKQELIKSIIVTRQQIALAMDYLLNLRRTDEYDSNTLAKQFAMNRGQAKPETIVIHPSVDVEATIAEAAAYFVSTIACAEAIWLLIYDGVFLHHSSVTDNDVHMRWTTVVPWSGGSSGGWTFDQFRIQVPTKVAFSPSHRLETNETLTDPGLFVLLAKINGADIEVVEAVQDSINCFRRHLFRAAVVLLGKAMEGAWIETGIALANSVPDGAAFNRTKFLELMTDESSIIRKVSEILKLYRNREYVGNVVDKYGVSAAEVENIVVWSEVLRDARNAVHFGVKPVIPNTYEKAAVLLLAGADNLSKLYHIKRNART